MPKCQRCGHDFPKLSRNKLCPGCGEKATVEAVRQLREKKGPYYDTWVRNIKAALEKEGK